MRIRSALSKKELKKSPVRTGDAPVQSAFDLYAQEFYQSLDGKGPSKGALKNSRRFIEFVLSKKTQLKEKFTMSALFVVMSATLVFFFVKGILTQSWIFSFSIDALIAAAAAAVCLVNLKAELGVLKIFGLYKWGVWMSIAAAVLCMLLEMLMPKGLDASFVILLAVYFIEKSRLKKSMTAQFPFASQSQK